LDLDTAPSSTVRSPRYLLINRHSPHPPNLQLTYSSNIEFVAKYTADLLSTSFPNMARPQVR